MFGQITEYLSTASPQILKDIFVYVTVLAEAYTVIAVCAAFYWCGNRETGQRLALTVAGGICLNALVKNIFRVPRIFTVSDKVSVTRIETATGYSFPSGHTQSASTLGGGIAFSFKKRWIDALVTVYILLVGYSRLVLGVHYITDVIAAIFLGIGWSTVSYLLYNRIAKSGRTIGFLVYLIPAALSLLTLLEGGTSKTQLKDLITGSAISAGVVLGVILERRFIVFDPSGSLMRKTLRLIVGFSAIGVLMGLFSFLPHSDVLSALKYFIVGFFAACGMPYIIKKFHI